MKGISHVVIGVAGVALAHEAAQGWAEPLARAWLTADSSPGLIQPHAIGPVHIGWAVALAAAVFGALAPDIDHPHATLRGWLGLASYQSALEVASRWGHALGGRFLGGFLALVLWLPVAVYRLILKTSLDLVLDHRGPTHTVWAIAGVWWLAWLCPWPDTGAAFALAYTLHIAADMLTRAGVPLLWPLSRHGLGWLPRPLRFATGSLAEWIIVVAVTAWTLWSWHFL